MVQDYDQAMQNTSHKPLEYVQAAALMRAI